MSYPKSFEGVRSAMLGFMRQSEPTLETLRDREMLKEEIKRISGVGGNIGSGLRNTGIKRGIDNLGRIVVPKELRNTQGWMQGDSIEIFYDEHAQTIVLKKYNMHTCVICESPQHLTTIKGKEICESCISALFEGAAENDSSYD